MKWNLFLGALVVSVGLCGQSFGFELLDRMMGLNGYGRNGCCEPTCCEKGPSCCEAAAPSCCDKGCDPGCGAAAACDTGCGCEPSCGCDSGCGNDCGCGHGHHRRHCCKGDVKCGCPHWGVRTCHSHDLFCGVRGLFHHHNHGCCDSGCGNGCCEQSCDGASHGCCDQGHGNGCCNNGNGCCEQTCAAGAACDPGCGAAAACEPSCGCDNGHHGCGNGCGCKKRCHRGCLLDIFGHKRCCKKSCGNGCGHHGNGCCEQTCAAACEPSCGCAPGNGSVPAPAVGAPTDAPMPPAPMADPQASTRSHRRVVQASKIVRAN